LLQLDWIDARHRDVCAHTVNHKGEQQKHQTTTQIAVFV
jgi:hypothetical protein